MLGAQSADEVRSPNAWAEWLHPDDRDRVSALVHEYLDGRASEEAAVFETECRLRRPDGSDLWVFARGAFRPAARAEPRRLIGTCIDVSERRHAEEALHRAQADVARLSRLTAMGELAASIAHEVNQPLCAIIANAQAGLRALRVGGDTNGDLIRDALGDVVTDARRASEVIQRTRQLFIERQEAKAVVSLNEIVCGVSVLAKPAVDGASVHATYALEPELPAVFADPVLLTQVILNLIMNALEAMSATTRRELHVSTGLGEDGVAVAVRDSGRGLHPDEAQEIFDALHSTKPEGMGMGLAISRAIVAAHGGRLWALANADAGATFQFVIPVADGVPPSADGGRRPGAH
jgi:PAS domain S-box-containing protein